MNRLLLSTALILFAHSFPLQVHGDAKEGPPLGERDDGLASLREALYSPNYRAHLKARRALAKIAKSTDDKRAVKAQSLVVEFEKEARKWLLSVGVNPKTVAKKSGIVSIRLVKKTSPRMFAYLHFVDGHTGIFMQGRHVTDQHLAYLSGMDVGFLEIYNANITGEALRSIELPSLKLLRINESPLTDEGVCKASLNSMYALNVAGTLVTNKLLAEPKLAKQLKSLCVEGTRVDSRGLLLLGAFKKLKLLGADFDDLSEDVVKMIRRHPSINIIRVSCSKENRKAAEALQGKLPGRRIIVTVRASAQQAT